MGIISFFLLTRFLTTKAHLCFFPHFLIYPIILGYLAPDKVDSKFFDPKFAFKEVEVQAKTVTELVTKKKPKVCLSNVVTLRFWISGKIGPDGSNRHHIKGPFNLLYFPP